MKKVKCNFVIELSEVNAKAVHGLLTNLAELLADNDDACPVALICTEVNSTVVIPAIDRADFVDLVVYPSIKRAAETKRRRG